MRKTAAVSFEGNSVKIVNASLKGDTLSVDKTLVISDDEFEFYLQKEKSSEFIVTCEFPNAYHDVLTVPAIKPKYLGKIIESEVRRASGMKDVSFIYASLGERVFEHRNVLDIFCYAVNSEDIRKVVDRFHLAGKVVSALYPPVFAAASLIDAGIPGEANMGVLGTGRDRTIFFTKNRAIYFIRNYESIDEEFGDFDIQNINMTINYCFQNLRQNPSAVVQMGSLTRSCAISTLPTAPLVSFCMPRNIRCGMEEFNECMLPIASFFTGRASNILSKDFRNIYLARNFMSHAVKVFMIITLVCLGFLFYEGRDIYAKKDAIAETRQGMADIRQISAEYLKREGKVRQFKPVVDFLNRPAPDIRELLVGLGEMNNRNFTLDRLEARAGEDNVFMVTITGAGLGNTYSSLQEMLRSLADELDSTAGVQVTDKVMNLKDRTFRVVMEYKGSE